MNAVQKSALIKQLDKSFQAMSITDKVITKHAIAAPDNNPSTGQPFKTFLEVIEHASDESLETLREDFEGNGLLLIEEQQS